MRLAIALPLVQSPFLPKIFSTHVLCTCTFGYEGVFRARVLFLTTLALIFYYAGHFSLVIYLFYKLPN